MSTSFAEVMQGAIGLGYWAVGLFFFNFWKRTRDRFFALFATAFWTLFIERVLLILIDPLNEVRPLVYCARLLAFCVIILAIVVKNNSPES